MDCRVRPGNDDSYSRRPRRTERAALSPRHGILEPVVAPEYFAAGHETRRAENPKRARLVGGRLIGPRDLARLGERDHAAGILADLAQRAGEVRLHPAFLMLNEPAPIGRARIVCAPAFLRA